MSPDDRPRRRPWLVQQPAGFPAEIATRKFASWKDLPGASAIRFADRPVCASLGTVLTSIASDEASRAFVAWLQRVARLRRGDRVALMPAWSWSTSTR